MGKLAFLWQLLHVQKQRDTRGILEQPDILKVDQFRPKRHRTFRVEYAQDFLWSSIGQQMKVIARPTSSEEMTDSLPNHPPLSGALLLSSLFPILFPSP
ncbi:hypothetical protein M378DRAFT_165894 [Amanita muscaria Koide BX008]|uniref:Uncharacterized protein n=1 Tax=Amanita muscaria (strain Koide BX008) TaxID=946122 RepID=A0A0C2X0X3_AMAMK|nr:hypothetical protein M378DRAFT_165894 [Amanita muscaria Koide BX008]